MDFPATRQRLDLRLALCCQFSHQSCKRLSGFSLSRCSTAGAVEKTPQEGRRQKRPGPMRQKPLRSSRSSPSLKSRTKEGAPEDEAEGAPEAAAVRLLSLCSSLSSPRPPKKERATTPTTNQEQKARQRLQRQRLQGRRPLGQRLQWPCLAPQIAI